MNTNNCLICQGKSIVCADLIYLIRYSEDGKTLKEILIAELIYASAMHYRNNVEEFDKKLSQEKNPLKKNASLVLYYLSKKYYRMYRNNQMIDERYVMEMIDQKMPLKQPEKKSKFIPIEKKSVGKGTKKKMNDKDHKAASAAGHPS